MDLAKIFKGQKVKIKCPGCKSEITLDASDIFKRNGSTKCPGCGITINFDTDECANDVKKELAKIAKLLK